MKGGTADVTKVVTGLRGGSANVTKVETGLREVELLT